MDWQGQKLAEQLMQYTLLVAALVALAAGYMTASYRLMLLIYVVGAGVTFLLVVPDWPFFNRNPLEWLDPKEADTPSIRAKEGDSLGSKVSKVKQQSAAKKGAKAAKR